jgi:hypothetical protein
MKRVRFQIVSGANPFSWISRALSQEITRFEHEADHSPQIRSGHSDLKKYPNSFARNQTLTFQTPARDLQNEYNNLISRSLYLLERICSFDQESFSCWAQRCYVIVGQK